jgi:DNA-binding response OmpR family regulator
MLQTTVLVMAKDRFIAVLVGALVELSGHAVAFTMDDESTDAAVRRTRPDLMLFDCALGRVACSEIITLARLEGLRVLMFSAAHTDREAHDIAGLYGAAVFVLPINPRDFQASVDRALSVAAPD